ARQPTTGGGAPEPGRRCAGHLGRQQTFFIKRWRALQPYSESTQRLAYYSGLSVGHRGRPNLCAMWLDCHAGVAAGASSGSLLTENRPALLAGAPLSSAYCYQRVLLAALIFNSAYFFTTSRNSSGL